MSSSSVTPFILQLNHGHVGISLNPNMPGTVQNCSRPLGRWAETDRREMGRLQSKGLQKKKRKQAMMDKLDGKVEK